MNLFKNYKFYITIGALIVLVCGLITDYFGLFIDEEIVTTIISYIISILISYNIITIDSTKKQSTEDIKTDLKQSVKDIKNETSKSKEKIATKKSQDQTK